MFPTDKDFYVGMFLVVVGVAAVAVPLYTLLAVQYFVFALELYGWGYGNYLAIPILV